MPSCVIHLFFFLSRVFFSYLFFGLYKFQLLPALPTEVALSCGMYNGLGGNCDRCQALLAFWKMAYVLVDRWRVQRVLFSSPTQS